MFRIRAAVVALVALAIVAGGALPAAAKNAGGYQTDALAWRAADAGFAGWSKVGTATSASGALVIDAATATPGTDAPGAFLGRNYYNGGAYLVGEAASPWTTSAFPFREAIASWNAETPSGTWIEAQLAVDVGHVTKSYVLGIWAADDSTIERHSVNLQGDTDGFVAVDTLVLFRKTPSATMFQLKLRLFRASGSTATPTVRTAAVAYSSTPEKPVATSAYTLTGSHVIAVPECSQMVYPDGGEVWCSPTSTSMVLARWSGESGPCEPRVRAAVDGVFDWVYDGHGNWPFNTAYAATQGLEGYVARFTSFQQVESWIAAGVPVVISYPWKKSTLTGAPIASSAGHLAVVVGFEADGDPVVNDPAAASDADVQRTYSRAELEALWLEHSGGTSYLIFPPGHAVPALP